MRRTRSKHYGFNTGEKGEVRTLWYKEIPMASPQGLVVDHSAVFSRIQGVCDDVGAVLIQRAKMDCRKLRNSINKISWASEAYWKVLCGLKSKFRRTESCPNY